MPVIIAHMHSDDINEVSKIHAQQFPRQHSSLTWIDCNFAAFPRIMIFVARNEKDRVVGYIQWIQKSGFRKEAIFELEQIAVQKEAQGRGIGSLLIEESLKLIKVYLEDSKSSLKAVLISTRSDNKAQELYKKTLGAEEVTVIKDLYSNDEMIMLARSI